MTCHRMCNISALVLIYVIKTQITAMLVMNIVSIWYDTVFLGVSKFNHMLYRTWCACVD